MTSQPDDVAAPSGGDRDQGKSGSTSNVRELPFVGDPALRDRAERDLAFLDVALKAGLAREVLIIASGVVEAVLKDLLARHGRSSAGFAVADLVRECGAYGLRVLSKRVEAGAGALCSGPRFYRPLEERGERESDPITPADAVAAGAFVQRVLVAVEEYWGLVAVL